MATPTPPGTRLVRVSTLLGGPLWLKGQDNFPSDLAKEVVAPHATLQQDRRGDPTRLRRLTFWLELAPNDDWAFTAYKEAELLVRALALVKDAPVWGEGVLVEAEENGVPRGIIPKISLNARDGPADWEPATHNANRKNRVRNRIAWAPYDPANPIPDEVGAQLAKLDTAGDFAKDLVEDYLKGLDTHHSEPSLALLYYAKVAERYAKERLGASKGRFLGKKTTRSLANVLSPYLEAPELDAVTNQLEKLRHTKSEAHLALAGPPTDEELRLIRKVARHLVGFALA